MSSSDTSSTELGLYDISIPVLKIRLRASKILLAKAKAYAEEKGFDLSVLMQARLAPDMYPLMKQFQIVTDFAKSCPARLLGKEPPAWEDNETSYDEIMERIERAEQILKECVKEEINQSVEQKVTLTLPVGEVTFDAKDYVLNFVLPNALFHLSTAHAILRSNGVPVGKLDFMGVAV